MYIGFGMLESGCVSLKNEVNIMMKNVVDIVLGGLTYWLFGFGMSFGVNKPTNSFIGSGGFLIDPPLIDKILPIRMEEDEELLGADLVEHRIRHMQVCPYEKNNYHIIF